MRLWHKDLILVLPRQQLISQWRECCAIAARLSNEGTPNHILVNKITRYPISHFISYTNLVLTELKRRGYIIHNITYEMFTTNLNNSIDYFNNDNVTCGSIFDDWHNDRYLTQCYYNLQEKFDCGGILYSEWELVERRYYELTHQKDDVRTHS